MTSGWGRLRQVYGRSALADVRDWATHSRLAAGLQSTASRAGRAVRGSWFYGWLTAEPDPEVIVIDLRETLLVGPVIELFDSAIVCVTRYWRHSWLQNAVATLGRVSRRLVATRAGQLLVRVLVPPEPASNANRPDDDDRGE